MYLETTEDKDEKTHQTGSRQPDAAKIAYDRKGYWFNARNKAVNWALNKKDS
ncbi:hypothetical protein [Blautia hydrogenotrophica]|uniref:Uncharacterized protein n=1 Tax=Blautia hydrogenotrophica (strain DSM 10507 / JCM 14656 / S5a33) TaxID=476272 RepID=C0CH29_BLAHS|nr:hypothetical protein [Blautia hydrogenotrophica]EEG50940.1 hypothetical protein RUMHYD_00142 [Blautia hydrogenotrophica DSM 10507]